MQPGGWRFSPGLWPSVTVVIVFPVLLSLGFWQLDRAEQKRQIYREFQQKQAAKPVNLNTDSSFRNDSEAVLWRTVRAAGEFDSGIHLLLDNQVREGEPGYFVFTPFRLARTDQYVLVNRGWVPAGPDRALPPEIDTVTGPAEITGIAKDVPFAGIKLDESTTEKMTENLVRLQQLKLENAADLTGKTLLPFVVRLMPESDHGFVRKWQLPGSGEEKHLGYAFQWFALAATLVLIYLFVNLKKTAGDNG